jgi:hypothetical protein
MKERSEFSYVITVETETIEKIVTGERITIMYEDEKLYEQYRGVDMVQNGNQTFVNDFLDNFSMAYQSKKGIEKGRDAVCNICGNSGKLLHFIPKRRLQFFNFKQKFFYFLLKHCFQCSKSSIMNCKKQIKIK